MLGQLPSLHFKVKVNITSVKISKYVTIFFFFFSFFFFKFQLNRSDRNLPRNPSFQLILAVSLCPSSKMKLTENGINGLSLIRTTIAENIDVIAFIGQKMSELKFWPIGCRPTISLKLYTDNIFHTRHQALVYRGR